jgi:nicotinate-nucleotide pyrophosphorylase (carboxylating)
MGLKSVNRLEPAPRCKSRPRLIKLAYDRSFFLVFRNPEYVRSVESIIGSLLKEDVGAGDVTSNLLLPDDAARAAIIANESGVLAGGEEFAWLCGQNNVAVTFLKKDGDRFAKGEKLFEIDGPGKEIFKIERTGLNLLQRMCGIATETNTLSAKLKNAGNEIAIAGTRKTQWGYLDKKAITLGGGFSHRLGLFESILIKDNHLDALRKRKVKDAIGQSIEKAWELRRRSVFIEVEAGNMKDAIAAAQKFKELQETTKEIKACIIMLDNMKPPDIRKTIRQLKKKKLYDYALLEASGGINGKNLIDYAKAGVDACSLGCLTHSSRAMDITQVLL